MKKCVGKMLMKLTPAGSLGSVVVWLKQLSKLTHWGIGIRTKRIVICYQNKFYLSYLILRASVSK